MKGLIMLTFLVTVIATVNAMYSNPFTWAMHRFYQYRGMDRNQDRYMDKYDNQSGQNRYHERLVLQGHPNYQYRSIGQRHQEQCQFQQCWDQFFMRRWGSGVMSEGNQNGGQKGGFQNYEQCSQGVSTLRQCLQQQLRSNGGCGCEYRDMMWAVRTAKDNDGMATYAFCDDFYNDYADRQCKDDHYRKCVQTVQRLSFAENRYRCDLRDEMSFAKQCINKYRGQPQPPSGCGNFNWFRYLEPAMEQVWMAEFNGCPVYDIERRCMNPMYEYFACGNQKDRIMNEYEQCVQKFASQDNRCNPLQQAKKAMQQFMRFMLEQHCQSDRQVKERFQQCCHGNEEKKEVTQDNNRGQNTNGSPRFEEKKSEKKEEKKMKMADVEGASRTNFEENSLQEKKNRHDNNNDRNREGSNQNGYKQGDRNGYEDRDKKSKGNSNNDNRFNESKQQQDKKTYNEQEDRKTKGGRHGNNRNSERGSDDYKPKEGEGRLAYLARIIKAWRNTQS